LCILRDCPPAEEPQGVLLEERSSPNFICSHVPMEILLFYGTWKTRGNKKRVVYVRGGCNTLCISWGLGTPLGSLMHLYMKLPYNIINLPLVTWYIRCELGADELIKNCCDQHCRRVLCRRRWIGSGLLLESIIREFSFPSFVTMKTWWISPTTRRKKSQTKTKVSKAFPDLSVVSAK
jgi:hypothetical protein